jgi:hypothetical protein
MNMKLSEFALTSLKNFSTINDGIVLRPGSTLRTVSAEENIFAEAEVDDVFPVEFGIFDLNNFLGNISALNNPELEFSDKQVVMDDGTISFSYYAKATELIDAPPAGKKVKLDNPDVTFDLPKETFQKLMKLASMNGLTHINVVGDNGTLKLRTYDKQNPDSNSALTPVGNYQGDNFTAIYKIEYLKMLPDDYVVDMKKGVFSRFTSKTRKLKYYITETQKTDKKNQE